MNFDQADEYSTDGNNQSTQKKDITRVNKRENDNPDVIEKIYYILEKTKETQHEIVCMTGIRRTFNKNMMNSFILIKMVKQILCQIIYLTR